MMTALRKDRSGYLLAGPNGAVALRNRSGRRYSDATTSSWDATKAIRTPTGWKVLLDGASSYEGKWYVWDINSSGVITKYSGWKTSAQATALKWEHTFSTDLNNDGFISGGSSYLLAGPNGAVTLRNRSGRRYSDATTSSWDATKAIRTPTGWKVLLDGASSYEGKWYVWDINSSGVITKYSGWKTSAQATALKWEHTFSTDLNNDGFISGGSSYLLAGPNGAVTLRNRSGRRYSDATTSSWDATKAIRTPTGWKVLLDGASSYEGKWYVWDINSSGVITKYSGWKTSAQATALKWEHTFSTDLNNDGFISGGSSYLLAGPNGAVTLRNRSGRRYSDATTSSWDATKAIRTPTGWKVLLDGASSYEGKWYVWDINSSGVITKYSGWKTVRGALLAGWESSFGDVIRRDGVIGLADDYDDSISTNGKVEINSPENGELEIEGDHDWFAITLTGGKRYQFDVFGITLEDPYLYLRGANGSVISSNDDGGAGRNSRLNFNPTRSGDYFLDIGAWANRGTGLYTISAIELAPVDDGDASFSISGNPEVGNTLTIARTADDPDGNGSSPTITWERSSDGNSWTTIATGSQLTLSDALAGQQLRATVSYIDGENFSEQVFTNTVEVIDSADDYADSVDTDGVVTIDALTTGELEDLADHDWFAVQLEAGKNYQFDLVGSSLRDPYLYLRDASGRLLTDDDDGGDGLNSQITFQPTSDGRYFLDAGAYDDAYTGTYTLSATQLAPPDPGFNSTDGYGHVNAKRAFENLLNISLSEQPALGGNLWGLDNINAPEVWAGGSGFSGVTGENVTIAVIDTGVDSNHSEFRGRITAGYDFVDDDTTADDGHGHGTHVAGTIAGANDGTGITGVAYDAEIMPIRVLGDSGTGSLADVIAGIRWAADNGADVINLSLGGGGYSQAMFDAVQHASRSGSVVIMAAGNEGYSSPGYPAAHAISYGMAIGAVDQWGDMAGFSNRAGSETMDYVTAPGVSIYSAIPGGGYSRFSGTSMAAPHVAGIAGLLKSHDANLSASRIETLLTQSASNMQSNVNSTTGNNSSDEIVSNFNVNQKHLITLETLDNFSAKELRDPLIGNLSGNRKTRGTTFESIERKIDREHASYTDVDSFETLDASKNLFSSLDFNNSRKSDPRETLRELLASNQFDYFEFDQTLTAL